MAQITYRGNLSARSFPFISKYLGRTVIVPQQDQAIIAKAATTGQDEVDKDRGIPQIYYCHNVMPTAEGFQAVGYMDVVFSGAGGSIFEKVFQLQNQEGLQVFFSSCKDGTNYVLPFGSSAWIKTTTLPEAAGKQVTIGSISGQTYIMYEGVGCYYYDNEINQLLEVELLGLEITEVLGITSSFGYMIAWTKTAIAWSSTVAHDIVSDPIDFVPSLVTGAGGGSVEQAKGKLTLIVPHYLGIIIYTSENAVAALYSGNAKFPFNFRPIVSAGGLANFDLISIDTTAGNHYAYTSSGLQLVGVTQAQTIYPEVTDFLSGRYFEDFNDVTQEFSYITAGSPFKKAISVISDRYLVMSYGIQELTHALIYDMAHKRFGKVKITHTACFEWKLLNPEVTETPRASIGFLQSSGLVKVVDFSFSSFSKDGTILLGKYQYVRSRLITFEEIQLESIMPGSEGKVTVLSSMDGRNIAFKTNPYLAYANDEYKKYNMRATALNHSILIQGNFYLSSFELVFHIGGKR